MIVTSISSMLNPTAKYNIVFFSILFVMLLMLK